MEDLFRMIVITMFVFGEASLLEEEGNNSSLLHPHRSGNWNADEGNHVQSLPPNVKSAAKGKLGTMMPRPGHHNDTARAQGIEKKIVGDRHLAQSGTIHHGGNMKKCSLRRKKNCSSLVKHRLKGEKMEGDTYNPRINLPKNKVTPPTHAPPMKSASYKHVNYEGTVEKNLRNVASMAISNTHNDIINKNDNLHEPDYVSYEDKTSEENIPREPNISSKPKPVSADINTRDNSYYQKSGPSGSSKKKFVRTDSLLKNSRHIGPIEGMTAGPGTPNINYAYINLHKPKYVSHDESSGEHVPFKLHQRTNSKPKVSQGRFSANPNLNRSSHEPKSVSIGLPKKKTDNVLKKSEQTGHVDGMMPGAGSGSIINGYGNHRFKSEVPNDALLSGEYEASASNKRLEDDRIAQKHQKMRKKNDLKFYYENNGNSGIKNTAMSSTELKKPRGTAGVSRPNESHLIIPKIILRDFFTTPTIVIPSRKKSYQEPDSDIDGISSEDYNEGDGSQEVVSFNTEKPKKSHTSYVELGDLKSVERDSKIERAKKNLMLLLAGTKTDGEQHFIFIHLDIDLTAPDSS